MKVTANSGRIPLRPPVRQAARVLVFAAGALMLLLLSVPEALGAPAVIATVPVGSGPFGV